MQSWIALHDNPGVGTVHSFWERARIQRRIAAGDVLFFRNSLRLTTITRVRAVERRPASRRVPRCPVCALSDIGLRGTLSPAYRCLRGHVFAEPASSICEGVMCELTLEPEKIDVLADIAVAELRPFELTNSPQLPLRPCETDALLRYISTRDHRAARGIRAWLCQEELTLSDLEAQAPQSRSIVDERAQHLRGVRLRRGPTDVRNALLRATARCAVSGCTITALLEVACIHGLSKVRNLANCILLRSDLHTLFDLNLLGIDPERLVSVIHPDLTGTPYAEFDGARLKISVGAGRRRALAARWSAFRLAQTRRTPPVDVPVERGPQLFATDSRPSRSHTRLLQTETAHAGGASTPL